jgi:small subunit ribosomal protein S16
MKGIVRIRLARFGRKHDPRYNIVVAKANAARDGLPIEVIGTYDPIPPAITQEQRNQGMKPIKDVQIDFTRSKYWLGVGAQPTETVCRLFRKAGILPEEWPGPSKGPQIPVRKQLEGVKVADL